MYSETEHNHGPNEAETQIQISKHRMKQGAAETFEMPAAVINKELANELPSEYRAHFPTESSVKRSIQRERNKNVPVLPKSLGEIDLKGDWTKTSRGEDWILVNKSLVDNSRVIVFCSKGFFNQLCGSKVWYADGTFSIAPQHFYQLYTIHVSICSQLLPVCFSLLTAKSGFAYREMFSAIKEQADEQGIRLKVDTLRTDFEK